MPDGVDTIYALSSGRPPAAIAVVRISGPRAGEAMRALTGRSLVPRRAMLVRVRDAGGETIDEALGLWFPGPHSETGEDVAELQLHGGRAVVAAVFDALGRLEGLRPAEPGEFTRRGFLNGKLDLTKVEGLADLIGAETEAQRRQAFRHMTGLLGDRAESWRARLIEAQALIEAPIDFSDEGDVPEDLSGPSLTIARELAGEMAAVLADGKRGERLREGLIVAIAGPPNVGKSTLLNRIAGREVAIVSPHAGTTRDVLEVHLDLGGYPVTLLDTAGVRDSNDPVEQEGIRRARARAAEADLVLWLVDGSSLEGMGSSMSPPPAAERHDNYLIVLNKMDKRGLKSEYEFGNESQYNFEFTSEIGLGAAVSRETLVSISASEGFGIDRLLDRISDFARRCLGEAEPAVLTRERHRSAVAAAMEALNRARALPGQGSEDLVAEELRSAAHALGRLTGRVDVEDVLDVVFRDFCIGK
ncbi:MAG: tRNA uridine-5-carboxymethylaminomethyl(34) synthesis GTPase MnmE [Pseudolabrys sp.]